jgi:hypothetical protein
MKTDYEIEIGKNILDERYLITSQQHIVDLYIDNFSLKA